MFVVIMTKIRLLGGVIIKVQLLGDIIIEGQLFFEFSMFIVLWYRVIVIMVQLFVGLMMKGEPSVVIMIKC